MNSFPCLLVTLMTEINSRFLGRAVPISKLQMEDLRSMNNWKSKQEPQKNFTGQEQINHAWLKLAITEIIKRMMMYENWIYPKEVKDQTLQDCRFVLLDVQKNAFN